MKYIHSFDWAELERRLVAVAEMPAHNSYLLLDGAQNPDLLRRLRASGRPGSACSPRATTAARS